MFSSNLKTALKTSLSSLLSLCLVWKMGTSTSTVYLSPLNFLLEVQECDGHPDILFHHSSFMDFLRSAERSGDYYIDPRKSHFLIAQWMLQLFTSDGMCPQSFYNLLSFS